SWALTYASASATSRGKSSRPRSDSATWRASAHRSSASSASVAAYRPIGDSAVAVPSSSVHRATSSAAASSPARTKSLSATTEQLVDAALERLGEAPARVADVGTGSGAIAVTLALRAPGIEVWASDTCSHALELASLNAERLGAQVHLVRGDLLDGLPRDL